MNVEYTLLVITRGEYQLPKFEQRLNALAMDGWRVHTCTDHTILMERQTVPDR